MQTGIKSKRPSLNTINPRIVPRDHLGHNNKTVQPMRIIPKLVVLLFSATPIGDDKSTKT